MSAELWSAVAVASLGAGAGLVRWLRVAQREHYLSGWVVRFWWRWWRSRPLNWLVGAALAVSVVAAWWSGWPVLATGALAVAAPLGLGMRGRSSPLRWTRRMIVLGAAAGVMEAALLSLAAFGAASGERAVWLALAVVISPLVVEAALGLTSPLEKAISRRFIEQARRKLEAIRPVVVAITGSYGKTTTKGYVAKLLGARYSVAASPKSYNNAMGLALTVNKHLPLGTEVLVAEMGTYSKGEIAAMCAWTKPRIGVITAIGPVHLERFGSEEAIAEAKSEILEGSEVAVLNVDYPLLEAIADRLEADGKRVWRTSSSLESKAQVKVVAEEGRARVFAEFPPGVAGEASPLQGELRLELVAPGNLACALAVALEMGVGFREALACASELPRAPHRLVPVESPSGVAVLDDTYNSNPAGARFALSALARYEAVGGRRVVVTPGMVEMGRCQKQANEDFGAEAAAVADLLIVVGRTNRKALVRGWYRGGGSQAICFESRDEAVAWVRENLSSGDAVLYENDLPDHYP